MESKMKIGGLGIKRWTDKNGQLHRTDGPAIEVINGYKEWWVNGLRHRDYGPAVEWSNGSKEWFINGKYHRVDGPAYEWINGFKEWYIDLSVSYDIAMGNA